jgi:hypothetical protein
MSIVTNVKEMADIIQKLGNLDLSKRIIELEREIFELTHENWELKKDKAELEQKLQFSKTMTFKEPFWYSEGDAVPACPRCWENDKKFIHLTDAHGNREYFNCPQCKQGFKAKRRTSTATLPLDLPNLGAY